MNVHLADGIVSTPLWAGGFLLAAAGCAWSAYKVRDEEIPRIAVFTAAFFVASAIHFPVGGTSVHLLFNGLLGVVLKRRALLAIPIGLLLQFMMLGFGGITVLGLNTCLFGFPALLSWKLFDWLSGENSKRQFFAASLSGVMGVLGAGILFMMVLVACGKEFEKLAYLVLLMHIPVMLIEGVVTGMVIHFLSRVQPTLLQGDS